MYPAKTISDADYADDIAILANTPNQAETLLHSLEQATAGIGLYVNAHKTEFICFNQTGNISTQDGSSPKLVDKFTYLGSSVSSTEKDIDTRLTKAWTAIDKLLIIWKPDLTDIYIYTSVLMIFSLLDLDTKEPIIYEFNFHDKEDTCVLSLIYISNSSFQSVMLVLIFIIFRGVYPWCNG